MKRPASLCVFMVASVGISGCGDNSTSVAKPQFQTSHEEGLPPAKNDVVVMFEEVIRIHNETADAMERGEPDAKLNELNAKVETIQKRIEERHLSDREKEQFSKRYQAELDKAIERVDKAATRRLEKIYGRKMEKK